MFCYLLLITVCTSVLAQDGCDPCDNPLDPDVQVPSMSGNRDGTNDNGGAILDAAQSSDNTYVTDSNNEICFEIEISSDPGSHIDLCSVTVSTKFVTGLSIDCGGGQASSEVVSGAGIQTTTLDLNIGDDVCVPDSASATCSLCVVSPTAEPSVFGFEAKACECCVDCEVGNWGPWGSCSVTCESGEEKRSRVVTQQPNSCGQQCPPLEASRPCDNPVVDCEVSEWSDWSECFVTCGTGLQERTRTITQQPNECGDECPNLVETKSCKKPAVECEVSPWTEWGECSVSCGTGIQERSREVTQQPNECGGECPHLEETKECEREIIDCEVSPWTEWGECSVSCGTGIQERTREVTQQPNECGDECPHLEETRECRYPAVDCEVSEWSDWSECSVTCGTGSQERTRTITQQPNECGDECPNLVETKSCRTPAVDCEVSQWTEWGECSVSCGIGSQERTREVTQQPNECGDECPHLEETKECEREIIDCVIGPWTEWGECDTSPDPCGDGVSTRNRVIVTPPNECGQKCPPQEQTMACSVPCCPEDEQEVIDCNSNKDLIASVELAGNEPGDVLYTQNMWMAIRGCQGKVLLAKNPAGQSIIILTLAEATNVREVCIEIRFCVQAFATLHGQDGDVITAPKGCPGEGGCCAGDCRCWTSVCWDFLTGDDVVGVVGVTSIEFEFSSLPKGKEWWFRGAYIGTCPPYFIEGA